jgi:hypothetical protein
MALVFFVSSFATLKAQNPLDEANAQLRTMFSQINSHPQQPRNFLYERSAHRADSAFFAPICSVVSDENNFMVTYEEVRNMAQNPSILPVSDTLYKRAVEGLNIQTVPIALIDYDFYFLKEDALNTNLFFEFDTINNILTDKIPQFIHPYSELQNVFAGSVLRFDVPSNHVKFLITPQFLLHDVHNAPYYTARRFKIDFGDGNGLIAFDPAVPHEHNVTHSSVGDKIIRVVIVDENNPDIVIKSTLSRLAVNGIDSPTQADDTLSDVEGFDVGVYYPCAASKDPNNDFKKLVIYVEGIDIMENRSTNDIYQGMLKDSRLEDLRNSGYTFLVLSYKNSRKSIIENGRHLVDLLHRLKREAIEKNNNEQFVVIGESMGGLVSRYALCYMESQAYRDTYRPQDTRMHNTRLLITVDSPHQGANIPLGLQALYRFVTLADINAWGLTNIVNAPRRFLFAKMNVFLDCQSAKEMLILYYHHTTSNGQYEEHIARRRFLQTMNALGNYPTFCKKVALANGSIDGENQRRPYGAENLREAGDVLMDFQAGLAVRIVGIKYAIYLAGTRITLRTNPNGTMGPPIANVQFGLMTIKVRVRWFGIKVILGPGIALNWQRYANTHPICTSAGGRNEIGDTRPAENAFDKGFDWFVIKAKSINNGDGHYKLDAGVGFSGILTAGFMIDIYSDGRDFCFIPTTSALDYSDGGRYGGGVPHLNRNIRAENINQKLAKTPFDVIMGWGDRRNHHHMELRNPTIWSNTPLGGNRRSCPQETVTFINRWGREQTIEKYAALLLNREIGDEQMYIENLTLNRRADFSAEYDIFVNMRNPNYQYPSQLFPAFLGIYSKEAPLTITEPTIEAHFFYDVPAGGIFNFNLPQTGKWKQHPETTMWVCCNAYILPRGNASPTVRPTEAKDKKASLVMFPNPNTDRKLTLKYELPKAEPITVEIHSLQGNKVTTISLGIAETNTLTYQTIDLSAHKLPAGVYMLTFRTPSTTFIQRLILR